MKSLQFNKDSWHYKLLSFYKAYHPDDLCTYGRKVLWLLFASCGLALLAALLLFSQGEMLGWLVAGLLWGFVDPGFAAGFGAIIWCVFGVGLCVVACVVAIEFLNRNVRERLDNSDPGFVRSSYKSWKDKYCARITFN